jgi:hypothetical protein
MGTIYHDELGPGKNHIEHYFPYVDQTARENDTSMQEREIGNLALVESDNTIWRLKQITPCIVWEFVSGPDETYKDFDIYLDPIAGDDLTGNGSASYPYKTFTRAFEDVPYWIKHKIRILPAAGTYTEFPTTVINRYTDSGKLIIDASGETYPVSAGPFTVNTVSGVGGAVPAGYSLATDLQVSGSPGWSTDQWYGKYIHVLTGNWAGYVLPIWKNTTDTIRTYADHYTFSNGDTFNIVDCPVYININNRVFVSGDSERLTDDYDPLDQDSPSSPHFLVSGVKIRIDKREPIIIKDVVSVMSFCNIIEGYDTDSDTFSLKLYNVSLNKEIIPSDSFGNNSLADQKAYSVNILPIDGAVPLSQGNGLLIKNTDLGPMLCRLSIFVANGRKMSFGAVFCGKITSGEKAIISIRDSFIEQINYSTTALVASRSFIEIHTIYIITGSYAISASERSSIAAYWLKGSIGGAYTLFIMTGSYFTRFDTDVSALGTSGAVYFFFDSSTHATWPTTGNSYDDGVGTWVIAKY